VEMVLLAAGQPLFGLLALAEKQAGCRGEGPLQVGVADLVAAGALLLAGRLVAAADQPSVGEKRADLGEAANVMNLVQQDQGQNLADAGYGTQAVKGLWVVHFGGPRKVQLQVGDLRIVGVDQSEIDSDVFLDAGIGEAFDNVQLGPVGGVGELLGEGRLVVLAVGVAEVDEGLGATADEEGAASEQVAGLTHALGVDVGLRQHAAAEQDGDLVGVDL